MITIEFAEACAEINEILKLLDENEVNKIPDELKQIFNKYQSKEYVPHIDSTKSLDKQKLKKKTKDILVELYVKYWCSKEDRQEVSKILNENYRKKQLELSEKYNTDNLFKDRDKIREYKQELQITKYEESIFKRIINKISRLFK